MLGRKLKKLLGITAIVTPVVGLFAYFAQAPKAVEGAEWISRQARLALLHVPQVTRYRSQELLDTLRGAGTTCVISAEPLDFFATGTTEALLVVWYPLDVNPEETRGGGCGQIWPSASHQISVIDARHWSLYHLEEDFEVEGNSHISEVVGPFVVSITSGGHRVYIFVHGNLNGSLQEIGKIEDAGFDTDASWENGELLLWTRFGMYKARPKQDGLTLTYYNPRVGTNVLKFIDGEDGNKSLSVNDDKIDLPNIDNNRDTKPVYTLRLTSPADKIFVAATCDGTGLRKSKGLSGAWIIKSTSKDDDRHLVCWDSGDDELGDQAASYYIKVELH